VGGVAGNVNIGGNTSITENTDIAGNVFLTTGGEREPAG
jgi:UDP-3-O-[3-hydroxymyristoyl] glucosamine N-acyltransferase